jgi:hypothetical protein
LRLLDFIVTYCRWCAMLAFNRRISRHGSTEAGSCFLLIDFSHSYPIEYKTGIVCYKCEIRCNGPRDRGSRNGSWIWFIVVRTLRALVAKIDRRYLAKNVFASRAAPWNAIHDRIVIDKCAEFLLKCIEGRLIRKQIDIERKQVRINSNIF